jgi:hypothetical protein
MALARQFDRKDRAVPGITRDINLASHFMQLGPN